MTVKTYRSYFKKYLELTGLDVNTLIVEKDPRKIEFQIIAFINKMKSEGKSYSAIHNYVAMILGFYKINDIVLNVNKINRFMPEERKIRNKDRGYTHEEISKILEFCDERSRCIVLLLASTGMRIGAVPSLRVGNIDNNNNKITVYEGFKEQYFTFMTPECKQAIDSYLDMRSRHGEKINDDSPLIREQFDRRDKFSITHSRAMARATLQWKLKELAKISNVRNKEVAVAHGFRKFFSTQIINAEVNPIHGLMLEGHSTGIRDHYARPTVEKIQQEYQKAVDNLTINEENKLRREVQELKQERTNYDFLNQKVESIQSSLVEILNMATKNKTPEEVNELYKSFERKLKNDK